MPNIKPAETSADAWPRDLDDLRAHPARVVTLADLAKLGLVNSYDAARRMPQPLNTHSKAKVWEVRTVMRHFGISPMVGERDEQRVA